MKVRPSHRESAASEKRRRRGGGLPDPPRLPGGTQSRLREVFVPTQAGSRPRCEEEPDSRQLSEEGQLSVESSSRRAADASAEEMAPTPANSESGGLLRQRSKARFGQGKPSLPF